MQASAARLLRLEALAFVARHLGFVTFTLARLDSEGSEFGARGAVLGVASPAVGPEREVGREDRDSEREPLGPAEAVRVGADYRDGGEGHVVA